jgi:ketosteroid isomerase-like protein
MSQENVEIVRMGCEAFNRGDSEWIDRFVDPECEVIEGRDIPGAATYRGHAGFRQALEHWTEQFTDLRVELERAVDDGDRVIWIVRQHAHGKVSGAPVHVRVGYISTFRAGRLVRWEMMSPKAALEAARLRE